MAKKIRKEKNLEKEMDKLLFRSRKEAIVLKFGIFYGVGCAILFVKFLISALISGGVAVLYFDKYHEMEIEAILIPLFAVASIYATIKLNKRVNIERQMNFRDLSVYFGKKYAEAIDKIVDEELENVYFEPTETIDEITDEDFEDLFVDPISVPEKAVA